MLLALEKIEPNLIGLVTSRFIAYCPYKSSASQRKMQYLSLFLRIP